MDMAVVMAPAGTTPATAMAATITGTILATATIAAMAMAAGTTPAMATTATILATAIAAITALADTAMAWVVTLAAMATVTTATTPAMATATMAIRPATRVMVTVRAALAVAMLPATQAHPGQAALTRAVSVGRTIAAGFPAPAMLRASSIRVRGKGRDRAARPLVPAPARVRFIKG